MNRRTFLAMMTQSSAASMTLAWLGPLKALAAPSAELWERWTRHDPKDDRIIDHQAWSDFLARYVVTNHPSGINRVRYRDVTGADKKSLAQYIDTLSGLPISSYNRAEQLAFWINLYNALTVKLILDHYPVPSIRKIKPSFWSSGPWDMKLLRVEGEEMTLNDIEHRILRPITKDPRIHYAVNCASLGCPNLMAEPFRGATVEKLLDAGARAYVNHPRGARFEGGDLVVSSIYDWYQVDFGDSEAGVLAHLRRYATGPLAQRLASYRGGLDYAYDWRLNEA